MSAVGPDKRTRADPEVLEFYRKLSFNYRASVDEHVVSIVHGDPASVHPPLDSLLAPDVRVLDVGCGVGWLSCAIALHRGARVTAIDFNPGAIERARAIADRLNLDVAFEVADLFQYEPGSPFDLVVSIGVLHHTSDCHAALRRVCETLTRPGGHLYIGLYHTYGRRPFLDHFAELRARGMGDDELFSEYRSLHSSITDDTHALSWFRDQVLHPKETQHTLKELLPLLETWGVTLIATSVNHFAPIESVDQLFEQERSLEAYARNQLAQRRFYPGFFTFLCRAAS